MQDENWQLKNAQHELKRKRAANGPRQIGHILPGVQPGAVWEADPEPAPPVRTYQVTPLDDFRLDHLQTAAQRARLQNALDKARAWRTACREQPGLSFVICGPVGVGKTTIAENLIRQFTIQVRITGDEDGRYASYIRAALNTLPADDSRRAALAAMLADGAPDATPAHSQVLNGRLVEATRLMALLSDGTPLDGAFGRAQVVVIDDAGEEDIPYTSEREHAVHTSFDRVRQKRYGRFLDYCYRHGKHVIVTSMHPLLIEKDGQKAVNPDFVNIFGQKAFSRLYQMARGYMCDLSGLPDYRPFMVEGIV